MLLPGCAERWYAKRHEFCIESLQKLGHLIVGHTMRLNGAVPIETLTTIRALGQLEDDSVLRELLPCSGDSLLPYVGVLGQRIVRTALKRPASIPRFEDHELRPPDRRQRLRRHRGVLRNHEAAFGVGHGFRSAVEGVI